MLNHHDHNDFDTIKHLISLPNSLLGPDQHLQHVVRRMRADVRILPQAELHSTTLSLHNFD